ncbi:MAG: CBS domain-containing protein [Thaumarchaeota archaeon]|nr:CBS domain-containing protein [Nitrososphaerota archaeon]
MASTFVKQIMKTDVVSIDENENVQDAAQQMIKSNIGCVIITKDNIPFGIFTESDFVRIAAKGNPLFTHLSGVVSTPLVVIAPGETIWEAAEIMKEKDIHKLPVQYENKIVGIITASDLVQICSMGSDSEMKKICDAILLRIKDTDYALGN